MPAPFQGLAPGLAPAAGPKPPAKPGGGYDAQLEGAAGDLAAAVKSGDAAAIATAFKAMHNICAGAPEE